MIRYMLKVAFRKLSYIAKLGCDYLGPDFIVQFAQGRSNILTPLGQSPALNQSASNGG